MLPCSTTAIPMSPKPLLFPSPTPHLPLSLPYHHPSSSPLKTHLPFPPISSSKTAFLGTTLLIFHDQNPRTRTTQFPFHPITAAVKRRKELPFDNVIQRDKKLKLVLKIRKILVSQPDRIMSLRELGRFRRDLGLTRKRRFIAVLKRYPAVFDIVEEGVYSLKFRLTAEADKNYMEELKARNEIEGLLVTKLRKLLMMSLEKRILIEKIAHLRTDLGLPVEFRDTICRRYPQYFKVVMMERGPALELTHWDPELAVSAAEESVEQKRIKEIEEKNLIIDRPPRFNRVRLPRGLNLSKGEMRRISLFRDMPYISPYSDVSELRAGTPEKEKHACGVVHEMLSLMAEKRTLVDYLTHFREEFRFSQQLRGMIIRHPDMFYVSLKGDRDSVFLREAYRDSQLIEKDKLLLIKEKLRALVAVPRFSRRGMRNVEVVNGVGGESGGEEGGDEWSDVENFNPVGTGDEFDDDDEEDEEEGESESGEDDDWSDEEDEVPPDFDDGLSFEERKAIRGVSKSTEVKEKELVPVLPDGRPRERW